VEESDRKRLGQVCRYITQPALSDERVQFNAAKQADLTLKTPWRDGTGLLTAAVAFGGAPCKGGAFQRVQAPPGKRSSRKHRSRHGGDEVSEAFGKACHESVAARVCGPYRE
jgi:hypothetical protein